MEAEYVALSTSCKDLFPLLDLVTELVSSVGIPFSSSPRFHVRIHEDNLGALTLAGLEPRRMTPCSKHYALKYHWFREHLGLRNVQLCNIATKHQLGGIFTKGIGRIAFERLQLKLIGW